MKTPPNRMHLSILMHNVIGSEIQRQTALNQGFIDLRNAPDLLLAALEEAGLAVVPIDATDAMIDAADSVDFSNEDTRGSCHNFWHVTVAASPYASQIEVPE